MKQLDEDTALAILFGNTRRKKRKVDLLTLAEACDFLVKLQGSRKAVAQEIGVSTEMIRQFLLPLGLPCEVQNLIRKRSIDSMDMVKELASLGDEVRQIAAAKVLLDTTSKEARDIGRILRTRDTSAEEAKKTVSEARPTKLHVLVLDLDGEAFGALRTEATDMGMDPADLAKKVVFDWLKRRRRSGEQQEPAP